MLDHHPDLKAWKFDLAISETVFGFIRWEDLLRLNSDYIKLWPNTNLEAAAVILSKEVDPMELLADIKRMKENGIVTFEDLAKELTEPNSILRKESMRLFLLYQKENNG